MAEGEPESTQRLRRQLARDSELIRRCQVLIEAARRDGYGCGWTEGRDYERKQAEGTIASLKLALAQARREAADAQAAIAKEPTQVNRKGMV